MFLHCESNHQTIFIIPFKSELPHATEFVFNNESVEEYDPESEDPFIQSYFDDLKSKTFLALNFSENASHGSVSQFFETLTNSGVEFVGKCSFGTDHERSIDFLRRLDLNIAYDKHTYRPIVWFVAFTNEEPFTILTTSPSKTKTSKKSQLENSEETSRLHLKKINTQIPMEFLSMDAWIQQSRDSHYKSEEEIETLKKNITKSLAEYDIEEKKYLETVELIRNKPNKDGWIKVLPKLSHTVVKQPILIQQIESGKKRKRDEVKEEYERKVPMYGFQVRQEKERNLQLLRQQFENARKKIELLKQYNVFESSLTKNIEM